MGSATAKRGDGRGTTRSTTAAAEASRAHAEVRVEWATDTAADVGEAVGRASRARVRATGTRAARAAARATANAAASAGSGALVSRVSVSEVSIVVERVLSEVRWVAVRASDGWATAGCGPTRASPVDADSAWTASTGPQARRGSAPWRTQSRCVRPHVHHRRTSRRRPRSRPGAPAVACAHPPAPRESSRRAPAPAHRPPSSAAGSAEGPCAGPGREAAAAPAVAARPHRSPRRRFRSRSHSSGRHRIARCAGRATGSSGAKSCSDQARAASEARVIGPAGTRGRASGRREVGRSRWKPWA